MPRELDLKYRAGYVHGLQVMFWDVRLDKLMKKGNKRVDEADVVWKPMHVVHLLSAAGENSAP